MGNDFHARLTPSSHQALSFPQNFSAQHCPLISIFHSSRTAHFELQETKTGGKLHRSFRALTCSSEAWMGRRGLDRLQLPAEGRRRKREAPCRRERRSSGDTARLRRRREAESGNQRESERGESGGSHCREMRSS